MTVPIHFSFPTSITFGEGTLSLVAELLSDKKLQSLLLVVDPNIKEFSFYEKLIGSLSSLKVVVADKFHKNPTFDDVERSLEQLDGLFPDAVMGLGGGVAMDVARGCVARLTLGHELPKDNEELPLEGRKKPYFITSPTTSGTGSEVGRSAILSNREAKKFVVFSPRLMADHVVADPETTLQLPPAITAAVGIDALVHNFEAFMAKGLHPLCDGIAQEGVRLIGRSLTKAYERGHIQERSDMMLGSLMGAVAFQKGLGLIHSMAHALSGLKDMHHGLANALMLNQGLLYNREVIPEKVERLHQLWGIDDVTSYLRKLGIPSLRDCGVSSSDIPTLATLAFEDFCHPCGPRPVTTEDFQRLFTQSLEEL